jgi:hypothetical protein
LGIEGRVSVRGEREDEATELPNPLPPRRAIN